MPVNGIEIKLGQVWKDRSGGLHVIVDKVTNSKYPWLSSSGESFMDDGVYSDGRPGLCDLKELAYCPEAAASMKAELDALRSRDRVMVASLLATGVPRALLDAIPSEASARAGEFVAMPAEPTIEIGNAYLDAANADTPLYRHRFNWAGYRAMVAYVKGGGK